ncbi:MAG: protein translocase subunit SecD [Planctomycetes bacterium]|jgi:SecD/SecF fusion protein|nr:protein translocase subunit SecD [Planctomycetota bacterium]
MLENASRQLFLVLLSIAAGLACIFLLPPTWGHDLKGGTQLRYEVPADVLKQMQEKEKNLSVDAIMAQTIQVIRDRIDPTGALDPLITRSGDTGILIELPYFQDKLELKRVLERVGNLGKLEMRIVADGDFVKDQIRFNMQFEKQKLETWLKNPENRQLIKDDYRNIRRFNDDVAQGPMAFGNLQWYPRLLRPTGGETKVWDRSFTAMGSELAGATVKFWEDTDPEFNNGQVPPAVLAKAPKDQFLVEFVALNMAERFFAGEHLDPAGVAAGPSRDGGIGVHYAIVAALTADYQKWSEQYIGKCSAIVLNGVVKSAPVFQSAIPGRGIISGDFTNEEVEELVKVLRTGSLRVEPELVSNEQIGPALGKEAIERGAWSLVAGGVLVFAFMLWYYGKAGTIACMTLVLNVFLLWAAMLFMQATITLPGLGGIVLTMGMAVDANVLIYERIREELAKGKDMLRAVRAGFERAMSAILDSNITTFLVGLVLFNVGVGPVRGFAVTLMVGILTTVFTQFFVTRLLFHYALEKGQLDSYKPRSLFGDLNVDFVRYMKPCLIGSAVLIVAGLAYMTLVAPREITLGMDFTGGANLQMVLAEPVDAQSVRDRLRNDAQFGKEYPNVGVNTLGEPTADGRSTQFNVRLKLNDGQRKAIEQGRAAYRDQKLAAADKNEPPPAAYEPPYVVELRRIYANDLVKPAFSDALEAPDAQGRSNVKFAQIDVHFAQPVAVADVRAKLQKGLPQSIVTALGDANATTAKDLRVEWTTDQNDRTFEFDDIVATELEGLVDADQKPILLSDPFPEAQEIQGRLVNDLRNAAIGALLLAWGLIVLYLRVRFHEYKYGIAAVVALIHDVLVALVVVVFCNSIGLVHAEIDLAMIACFLTIIGYSVNDTIVIFDRIRENVSENTRIGTSEPFRLIINRALNQTMSRTLLTSGLTLMVVVAQFAANITSESGLASFAFAMMIGMVAGVYSTIFIAAPILIWLDKGQDNLHSGTPAQAAAAQQVPATTPKA